MTNQKGVHLISLRFLTNLLGQVTIQYCLGFLHPKRHGGEMRQPIGQEIACHFSQDHAIALEADRITEVSRLTNDAQVNATGDFRKPFGHHPGEDKSRKVSTKSDQTWPLLPSLCNYHSRFGEQARSCLQPCKFQTASKTGNCPTGRQ